ncbi:MAG: solute carrier organic anion transporter, partial [Myxococcales bacterium]|nr:solute carrier organic anion transporter [Myxococcales bacterium]
MFSLLFASCGGTADEGPSASCGDGLCNAEETCASCASDCGACPTGCGDAVCTAEETCASCATDCGACPIGCGDEVCAADETCTSCATDCGLCPDLCGDGTCNVFELCSTCDADCGTCPDTPATVTRGPYLQSGSSSGVVIRWRSDGDTDSVVAYGDSPTSLTNVASSSTTTGEHGVRIEGLAADTRYYYAIGSSTAP